MIDKELEEKIKKTKEFMELWMKFHELYQAAQKKEIIDAQEERAFLETKSLITRKYQALTDFLGVAPTSEDKTFEVISQVLSLQGVSAFSDVQIEEIENGWHRSFLLLNKLLGGFENRKETLAKINLFSRLFPKIFSVFRKRPVQKAVKIGIVIFLAYLILIKTFHMEEKLRIVLLGFPPIQGLLKSMGWDAERE